MRVPRRKHFGILAHTIVGTILGAAAGLWLGRAILLHTAEVGLSDYARELTHQAGELNGELNRLFHRDNRRFAFCSDQELTELQSETFDSHDLKDIGRTRSGKLYCSAFLGRLAHPYLEGPPTMVLADGMNVYTNVAVVMASSKGDLATVLEWGETDAVLNPGAFDHWGRSHIHYMISAVNRTTGQTAAIAGIPLRIEPAWIQSEARARVADIIYQTRCSGPLCAVTAESITDIWASSRATQISYASMGGLAGFNLGLAVGLLYLRTLSVAAQLHRALRTDSASLHLVYEPILDGQTQRFLGAEALLRWTDQEGNPVPPDVFVPIAESKGFIGDLTAFVVRRATRELGDLLREHPELTLSINIAASDMNGEQLFQLLEEHVLRAGILPGQIVLELTERSTADLSVVSRAIRHLRGNGYGVHIDDFGTGFSSLSYLDQLAVNAIKIDRAFTRTIGTEAVTAPILPQMLAMAESLGMEVIVEGVETLGQQDFLQSTGKTMKVQGWYYSRPMLVESLLAFYQQNDGVSSPAGNELVQA